MQAHLSFHFLGYHSWLVFIAGLVLIMWAIFICFFKKKLRNILPTLILLCLSATTHCGSLSCDNHVTRASHLICSFFKNYSKTLVPIDFLMSLFVILSLLITCRIYTLTAMVVNWVWTQHYSCQSWVIAWHMPIYTCSYNSKYVVIGP